MTPSLHNYTSGRSHNAALGRKILFSVNWGTFASLPMFESTTYSVFQIIHVLKLAEQVACLNFIAGLLSYCFILFQLAQQLLKTSFLDLTRLNLFLSGSASALPALYRWGLFCPNPSEKIGGSKSRLERKYHMSAGIAGGKLLTNGL